MRQLTRLACAALLLSCICVPSARAQDGQQSIPQISALPDVPRALPTRDWRTTALAFDRLTFAPDAHGPYLPLLRWDDHQTTAPRRTFSLPSYVGSARDSAHESQEGITCLAAVLAGTLVGVDKARGAHNWVQMSEAFYQPRADVGLVLNNIGSTGAGSFWYDLWPQILFDGLAYLYPAVPDTAKIMRASADRWRDVTVSLTGPDGVPNFDHTGFDYRAMRPIDNGRWREPDGAAGAAWVEYMAWVRWHDSRYRDATFGALAFLNKRRDSPLYEVLLPFGALTAARANAEAGRRYDVGKMIGWCFGPSPTRPGWGLVSAGTGASDWGGYDCGGLIGSSTDGGGYGFAMNTFAYGAALVPLTRYDPRYASAVGKWMLHAAAGAQLFYADALPSDHHSCPDWPGDPAHGIAYEGLRRSWKTSDGQQLSPYAAGDALRGGWARTDFGMYGAACVGFFGAIIGRTSDPAILRLDCLATDFFHAPAYPTSLYYNPWPTTKRIAVPLPAGRWRLYDAVSHRFFSAVVQGQATITLSARSAAVVVMTPAEGRGRHQGVWFQWNGRTIDFHYAASRPASGKGSLSH